MNEKKEEIEEYKKEEEYEKSTNDSSIEKKRMGNGNYLVKPVNSKAVPDTFMTDPDKSGVISPKK